MAYNRFRLQIIIRSLMLGISVFFLFYMLNNNYTVTAFFVLLLFGVQIVLLINFTDKTNRDLSRFLNSIEFKDFSQNFNERNSGSSFRELHSAFNNIIQQFQKTRSEMEEHFQYLQTIVKHVRTGLISYNRHGDIELINDAAKELLGMDNILNIKQLSTISIALTETLTSIRTGTKSLVRVANKNKMIQLSVSAAQFKMRGRNYTLVSLQDITNELENERLTNEMDIARVLQKKLLPLMFPEIPGYYVSAECLPALEVGGDYFDFITLDDHRIGIVIADVSGKGLPAAFYMTLAKGIFQSNAAASFSPKEVLIRMNSLIYRTIEKRSFITMMYAILDFRLNKILLARAGHEPAVYYNKYSDMVKLLQPKGIGLGLESGEIFSQSVVEEEIQLNPGDSLLLYTDGLTDTKNENNNELGMDKLLEILSKYKNNTPDDLPKLLLKEIHHFKNTSPQYDDITFITLTRNSTD